MIKLSPVLSFLLFGTLLACNSISAVVAQPAPQAAEQAVLNAVRDRPQDLGLSASDVAEVRTTNTGTTSRNLSTIFLQQELQGIQVYNGRLVGVVATDGVTVLSIRQTFQENLQACTAGERSPNVSQQDAVQAAASQFGVSIETPLAVISNEGGPERKVVLEGNNELSMDDEIPVSLAFFITGDSDCDVKLVWVVTVHPNSNDWGNVLVDANTGSVLYFETWVTGATMTVFTEPQEAPCTTCTNYPVATTQGYNPYVVNQPVVTTVPDAWLDGNTGLTQGNNCRAGEDTANTNNANPVSATSGTNVFNHGVDLSQPGLVPSDWRNAAVVNLFYWNNIMHDMLYQYGFDEASGNFQENNFGKGGFGSDSVNADAQDGSGTNNANFATPPDGSNPRMQMFLWSGYSPASVTVGQVTYYGNKADFGPTSATIPETGVVEMVASTTTTECTALTDTQYTGKLVLINRGDCEFGTKVFNAQTRGAVGVVVANNVAGSSIPMAPGADGSKVTIPSMMVSMAVGATISLPESSSSMQISEPGPELDSSFDAGVIAHEYCHGLSIRLTGGANSNNCLQGEQAGEGWSDYCGIHVTSTSASDRIRTTGAYVSGSPNGIRPYPYTNDMTINPLTYADVGTSSLSVPHGIGSFFATCLWDMTLAIMDFEKSQGRTEFNVDKTQPTIGGNNIAFQYVVDGLKLQGCNPNFVDSRDGILQAANGTEHYCIVYQAFARRGLGFSAVSNSNNQVNVPTEAFDLPPECCGDVNCNEECLEKDQAPEGGCTSSTNCCAGVGACTGGKPANRVCLPVTTSCTDAMECDDGDDCTIDTCESGSCVNTPIECDDGVLCTSDTCESGSCVYTPISCGCAGNKASCQNNAECCSNKCVNFSCKGGRRLGMFP